MERLRTTVQALDAELRKRPEEEVKEMRLRDEDVDAVRKAFEVMGKVVLDSKGKLQIIVMDHASRDIWGDIRGIVGLKEWRDGIKLVQLLGVATMTGSERLSAAVRIPQPNDGGCRKQPFRLFFANGRSTFGT